MEVWVRSKSKEKFLCIKNVEYKTSHSFENEYNEIVANGDVTLGVYATKERCLEIIDEIQSALTCCIGKVVNCKTSPTFSFNEQSVVVYEMPQE